MRHKLLFFASIGLTVMKPTAGAFANGSDLGAVLSEQNRVDAGLPIFDNRSFETGTGGFEIDTGGIGTGTGRLPEDIWGVVLEEVLGNDNIFGSDGGFETGSGGIPGDIWETIIGGQGTAVGDIWNGTLNGNEIPDYSNIFGDVDITGNTDFGNGVITNLNSGSLGPLLGMTNPDGGTTQPSSSTPTASRGFNPFRWIAQWSKKKLISPVLQALGIGGERPRTPFNNGALGTLNRNSIVQRRDQANLLSQELARLMAAPRLGKEGEEWIESEAKETLEVLETGVEETNKAIELAVSAQELTSTQDVAKAVAHIGGHNAKVSSSVLQLQAQNQASLIQLQQIMSASIELEANISEALDESNRRERLERASAFYENAGETIYLRGIFSED